MEEWKFVKGWEWELEVSNMGNIRVAEHIIEDTWLICKVIPPKPLVILKDANSRSYIHYKKRYLFLNDIMLNAFFRPRGKYKFLLHKNGLRDDFRLSNLELVNYNPYGTRKPKAVMDTENLWALEEKAKVLSLEQYLYSE